MVTEGIKLKAKTFKWPKIPKRKTEQQLEAPIHA